MPEAIETEHVPPADSFNTMKDKFNQLMEGVIKDNPKMSVELDTTPKDPPELKKIPLSEDRKNAAQKTAKVETVAEKKSEPVAEKPAETPAADVDPVNPKAADWKKLKAERDALRAQAEAAAKWEKEATEYRTKLSEVTAKVNPEEVETLRKRSATLEEQIERLSLENSEKFKGYYGPKIERAKQRAIDSVGKDKADQMKALLDAPPSAWRKAALNDMLTGLESEYDKTSLVVAMSELDNVLSERNSQLENWKVNMQKLRETEAEKANAEQQRIIATKREWAESVLKGASKLESFQEKEGDAEHNAEVKQNIDRVKAFITGEGNLDDNEVALMPVMAAEAKRLQKLLPRLEARIKELEEANGSLKAADPSKGGNPSAGNPFPEKKTFKDAFMSNWTGKPA